MKQKLLLALLANAAIAGCAVAPPEASLPAAATSTLSAPGAPSNAAALAGMREMKMAFDVTDGDPRALLLKLTVIDLTRKQLVDAGVTPRIVVAFRGDASFYTQPDLSKVKETDRADAIQVMAKIRALKNAPGVETLEQCNVPLAAQSQATPANAQSRCCLTTSHGGTPRSLLQSSCFISRSSRGLCHMRPVGSLLLWWEPLCQNCRPFR